jgi:hypothetical protein
VTSVRAERAGLIQVQVQIDSNQPVPAHALSQQVGPIEVGDQVVVNTTAVERGLGTGGSHIVHWNLSREYQGELGPGHIVKLRYLSNQMDTGAWEETQSNSAQPRAATLRETLAGVRVVLCQLHSHVGAVAVGVRHVCPGARIGYVMTDGGALPLALSDLVASLRASGVINATATAGQAFGGDFETVNVATAVQALQRDGCEMIVLGIGPGHVGTGTQLGFSGLDLAGHAALLTKLGADVGLALRASDADQRDRHRGIGHHTATLVELTDTGVALPFPIDRAVAAEELMGLAVSRAALVDPINLVEAAGAVGLNIESMGRRLFDDATAVAFLGAAAAWAANGATVGR